MADQHFGLTVNGQRHTVLVPPEMPLLYVLRDTLGFDGTRFGCGLGQCGSCTVHLNGAPVRSCVFPISAVGSQRVTTIEGLSEGAQMSALQRAFVEAQAPQCGYCMSGMIMTAAALLKQNPHPTEPQIRDALDGNLCRCATHVRVVRAVEAVATGKVV